MGKDKVGYSGENFVDFELKSHVNLHVNLNVN